MKKEIKTTPIFDFLERIEHPKLNFIIKQSLDIVAKEFYAKLDIPEYTFAQREVLFLKIKYFFVQKLISYLSDNHDGEHTTLQLLKNHERLYAGQIRSNCRKNALSVEFITAANEIAQTIVDKQASEFYIEFCLDIMKTNRKFFM